MNLFNKLIAGVFILLFNFSFFNSAFCQAWLENLPKIDDNEHLSFYDYQKAFNDYWEPKKVGRDGFYFEDGIKKKAIGWKQFKRWEWNMLGKIDLATGLLPSKTAQQVYDEYFRNLPIGPRSTTSNWSSLGVNGMGRVNCISFHPSNLNTYWVGSPSGGLWVTSNNGTSWSCLTDNNDVLGVNDIVIPTDYLSSNTIYIATGDRDGADNYSVGVLKSTNGGTTWNSTGLSFMLSTGDQVTRLLLDPNNNQTLIAATTDGVYKTTNGGSNWTLLDTKSFIDMEYKPGNFSILYGSTKTGKIYYSTNNGSTWNLAIDLYNAGGRRIELAVSSNQSSWVYGVVAATDNGLFGVYKSTNSGSSFTQVFSGSTLNLLGWDSSGNGSGGQGWYDLSLAVSPSNANTVILGGVLTWKSTNGGTNWIYSNGGAHVDKHMHKYRSNGDLFECNDGGIYLSTDNASTWTNKSSNLGIAQMYKLGCSSTVSNEVITGLQDNGTRLLSNSTWSYVLSGDGMECLIDYTNVNIQYACYQYGGICRTLNHWTTDVEISPANAGDGAWVTPYIIDPNNHNILYAGYADVWKTTNQGTTWTKISNFSSSSKMLAMAIAPSDPQVIYTSDIDNIWKTTNGGSSWTNINGTLPLSNSRITSIAVKSNNSSYIWVTLSGFYSDRVYQSSNGGTTWQSISSGLPSLPAYSIVQNTQITSEDHLYVGTELGIYFKKGSDNWIPYDVNLPNVKIGELEFLKNVTDPEQSKIRAATYGRGLWESYVYYGEGVTVPTNVQASDGTYSDKVVVTWNGTSGNYFRVFRNTTNNSGSATALGSWQTSTTYNDVSATPNVTYYYWVKAASDANGSNSSAFSNYDTGWRGGVTVPTNVQASDGTYSDKVVVTWNGTSGNYFRVYRNTTNNSGSATALGSWQTSTTYNDASATPNVTYYYWVKAASDANGSNSSAFSNYDTGWRGGVTVPTNVQASDGTYSDKVVVTWNGTSGNYFRVYRNTTNNSGSATALGSWQTSTTYNDASATPNVTYYYWVKAGSDANGSNSSAFSNYDTGWRGGVTVPTNVQASDGTYSDKVVVTWNGTSGNYFRVFRNTTNNSGSATALGSWQTSTTYNDASATPNVTYYYWVKAASDANGSNSSAFSNYDTGWRSGVTVPTNVQASDGTYNDKVVVTWAGTSGNYFRVYRNTTNNSGTATALGSWQTSTTYNDASATPNLTYYYWVKAASDANGSNSSAFSNYDTGWRSGVTVPTNVQASDGTYIDKIVVTWTGTSGNYFRVFRNTTNNSSSATALGIWQTSTTYNDLSATPNVTYYYWVKAASDANGSNSSPFSNYDTGWRNVVTVPTNVQATDGTYNDKVVVTWAGTSGNYFRVFRNTTNNSNTATALGSWQTATTYNDVSATPDITYYYWVKAASDTNGSNSSDFSTYDTGWRHGATLPTNVQASDGTYFDKVVVTWNGAAGNYFRVYRNTTNNSGSATALGSWQTSTTYNDASATPNLTYYYWVKAATDANGSNSSAFSSYDTGWRSGVTVPTNVQASDGTYNYKIVVTWNGASGNYFRVFRNTTNNSGSAIAMGNWQTSTTYNDFTATPLITYYYWVKAASDANGSNSSAFSSYDTGWRSGSSNIFPPNNDCAFTSPDINILSINKKSIDNDFTNSNSHETSLIIYPSPLVTDAAFNLKYNSAADSEATVSIVDINGNIVKKVEIFVNVGENVFTMDSPEVPGIYVCIINLVNGNNINQKFIIY